MSHTQSRSQTRTQRSTHTHTYTHQCDDTLTTEDQMDLTTTHTNTTTTSSHSCDATTFTTAAGWGYITCTWQLGCKLNLTQLIPTTHWAELQKISSSRSKKEFQLRNLAKGESKKMSENTTTVYLSMCKKRTCMLYLFYTPSTPTITQTRATTSPHHRQQPCWHACRNLACPLFKSF